jgi:polyhydroxyalkanoate synthesis repressor PhaR
MDQVETKFKVIKKYRNRKFYDTETSQYVTLRDIQDTVKTGREVLVIDNASKRDITAKTLLASLVETESDREDLSTAEVVALIKKGFTSKTETVVETLK